MKKIVSIMLTVTMLVTMVISLVGCGTQGTAGSGAKAKKIGIVQIVEHPSLNQIRESIIKEMEANGYKDGEQIQIDYQNAQGDISNLTTICKKFVSSKYDMIIAIATPSAQQAMAETSKIPVIFSACTDPLGSGLVSDLEKPGANITGTSDAISAQMIMELAQKLTPGIKSVGALYNLSEANSVSVINDLKEFAKNNGITVEEATVTSSADVQQAVNSLVGKVDAIFSPIDNTVASAMSVVAESAKEAKVPVYVGADSMVKDGGLATYGINYDILGKETAKMAVEVLKGKKPGEIPVKMMKEMDIYVNTDTAASLGITIPEDVLSKAIVLKND